MLNLAVRNTKKLVRQMVKENNSRIGRFFTKKEDAQIMLSYLQIEKQSDISILDPGAGTGILSCALIEQLCKSGASFISLTCYETNASYIAMLENNLERVRKIAKHDYQVKLKYSIICGDYLKSQQEPLYDYIIMNPPQELLPQSEINPFPSILTFTPPLYALFLLQASKQLKDEGQLVSFFPVSSITNVALRLFRKELFTSLRLDHISSFDRINTKNPLQNNLIIKLTKTPFPNYTLFVHHYAPQGDGYIEKSKDEYVPEDVINPNDYSLLLSHPTEDHQVLQIISKQPCRFSDYQLKVHTGLLIEARVRNYVLEQPCANAIPVIHPKHLVNGSIAFPLDGVAHQYLLPQQKNVVQESRNVILMKRVPAKKDPRILMCAPLLRSAIPTQEFSTSNKLNYIDTTSPNEMDPPFLYGLFAYLSSKGVDEYYRSISKSTQINAKELEKLPLPKIELLRKIGSNILQMRAYDPDYCTKIVHSILGIK